jgi:hypothetical protein
MWAGFMKVATRSDKPEWLPKPESVVGANVCRISGKLPASGCDDVEVINRDGFVERRSMIYTEYFVKGTQPTTTCPIHRDGSFLDALTGMFGRNTGPPPVPVTATGLPTASAPPTSTTGTAPIAESVPHTSPAQTVSPPEQAKKRGFWSRIFGGGSRQPKTDDKKKEQREKKPE